MSRQRMKRAGHQAAQMLRARTDHLYRILQTAPHSKERLEAVKLACRELDLSKSRLYELLAVYSLHGFEALKRKRRSDCRTWCEPIPDMHSRHARGDHRPLDAAATPESHAAEMARIRETVKVDPSSGMQTVELPTFKEQLIEALADPVVLAAVAEPLSLLIVEMTREFLNNTNN